MKNYVVKTKEFVHRNKTALVVAAVTIPVIVLQARANKNLNAFLIEKDLFNEFYLPELTGE